LQKHCKNIAKTLPHALRHTLFCLNIGTINVILKFLFAIASMKAGVLFPIPLWLVSHYMNFPIRLPLSGKVYLIISLTSGIAPAGRSPWIRPAPFALRIIRPNELYRDAVQPMLIPATVEVATRDIWQGNEQIPMLLCLLLGDDVLSAEQSTEPVESYNRSRKDGGALGGVG
jgi:hypothetical protein